MANVYRLVKYATIGDSSPPTVVVQQMPLVYQAPAIHHIPNQAPAFYQTPTVPQDTGVYPVIVKN